MPIGIIVDCLSVIFGGLIGAMLGNKIPQKLKHTLPLIFGLSAMAMGVNSIIKTNNMSAVILSAILGTVIGELLNLEKGMEKLGDIFKKLIEKIFLKNSFDMDNSEFSSQFVVVMILLCTGSTGIFGAMHSAMTGNHSILLSKSVLDFFTAIIFATSLSYVVVVVSIPQFFVLMLMYKLATFIIPLTTPLMLADFSGIGGLLLLATGLRVSGIKSFSVTNMLPAMVVVMPLSCFFKIIFG